MLPVSLTPKEIEVLAAFLALPEEIVDDDRFNSFARKKVRSMLSLSPGGLANYLKSLLEKGFLDKSQFSKKITVKEFLIPEKDWQGYQFKIERKDNIPKSKNEILHGEQLES